MVYKKRRNNVRWSWHKKRENIFIYMKKNKLEKKELKIPQSFGRKPDSNSKATEKMIVEINM